MHPVVRVSTEHVISNRLDNTYAHVYGFSTQISEKVNKNLKVDVVIYYAFKNNHGLGEQHRKKDYGFLIPKSVQIFFYNNIIITIGLKEK